MNKWIKASSVRHDSPSRADWHHAGMLDPLPMTRATARWLRGLVLLALLAGTSPWRLALAQAPADAAPWQWRVTDTDSGTQVWLQDRGDLPPAFRATTRIQARLSSLVALLLDRSAMPEWVYRTASVQLLHQDGPQQGVSLVVTAMPWPLDDREAVVSWQLRQSPANAVVSLSDHSVEPAGQPWLPEVAPGRVRMPSFGSQWVFAPVAGAPGEVDVRFEGHGDPGGNLALPLLRSFVHGAIWQAPLQTVNALRKLVQRPAYRDAVLPFITEPTP